MIVIYTSPGCAGCRKLKQWLKDREIEYKEKNIFKVLLSPEEIKYLLMRTDNGAEDIISKRSKVILENHINIDDMTVDELIKFIQQNPSVLKRPIILNENNLSVMLLRENQKIDLGGIAKGYIADKIIDFYKQNNVKSAIINIDQLIIVK